jgi:transcriptional regulator with XRE-family HTH domain
MKVQFSIRKIGLFGKLGEERKMGLDIGRLLYGIRTKYQISVNDICRGICGVSTYCMYENDEMIPDILSVNMFLDRMGFGTLGVSAYISKKEAVYFQWRESTRECIQSEKYKNLSKLSECMPTKNMMLNEKIRQQYDWFLKGIIAEKEALDFESAKDYYEQALRCTCSFLIETEKIEGALGVTELHIYAIYLNLLRQMKPKEKNQIACRLFQLMKYVQTHFAEEQQKVKIYPLLVCLWGNLTMDEKSEKNRYEIFDQTFQLLRRRKSLYCLLDIMRLRILSGVKEKRSMTREQGELQILQSFFEEFGYQAKSQIYVPQANEIMLEHVGQYLSTERKKVNYTQEKISDGICSVESYSRIENGRKPTRNNYKALTEKIGTENRYYIELVNTGNIDALLLRREISYELFMERNERLPELLEELKKVLGEKEVAKNRQYLEYIETCIERRNNHISEKECYQEYRKILAYSLDENLIGENKHIYSKIEINLINHIAVCLSRTGEKEQAKRLIKLFLKDIEQAKTCKYHEAKLAKLNYGKWLSDAGEYVEAERIFSEGVSQIVERDRAELLDQYIGEMAYNEYLINDSKKDEQIKRHSLYALIFSQLFGTEENYKIISEFYRQN